PNVLRLVPYSSARDEFKGEAAIALDANENSFGSPVDGGYNRYPDPLQKKVKDKLSEIKGVRAENIFLGNGSDEAIDLLFCAFCLLRNDNVIIFLQTYGMNVVSVIINGVRTVKTDRVSDLDLDLPSIVDKIDA